MMEEKKKEGGGGGGGGVEKEGSATTTITTASGSTETTTQSPLTKEAIEGDEKRSGVELAATTTAMEETKQVGEKREPICFSLPMPTKRRRLSHSINSIKEPVSRRPLETMPAQTPPEFEKLSDDEKTFPAAEALRMYELKRWIETNEQRCTTKLKQILPKIDPSRLNFHDRLLREKILGTEYGRTGSSQTSQFAIERLEDLKVTFVLNVFPSGFSIDNQPQVAVSRET